MNLDTRSGARGRSPRTEMGGRVGTTDDRLDVMGIVALAAATTLGLEQIRVYVSDLVWIVGETTSRPVLGALAVAPFLAIALAGMFLRLVGPRRGLVLSAVWLAGGSLAERASSVPLADLGIAAVCALSWGWCLVAAAVTMRRGLALGLVMGGAVDLTLRLAFLTVDLPWTDQPVATGLTAVLVGTTILGFRRAATRVSATGEPEWIQIVPLLGLGSWLTLTMLVVGNPSQVMARTGAGFGVTVGALAIGHAAGIQLVSGMVARPGMAAGLALIGGVGSLAFIPFWSGWPGGALWAAVAAAATTLLAAGALQPSEAKPTRGSATATGVWLAGAGVVFVGLAYFYYTTYGPPALIAGMVVGLVAAGVAGAAFRLRESERPSFDTIWPPTAVAGLLLVVGTFRALSWSAPVATEIAPNELTVLTYNIRAGFGSDNRWDLERTARVIEAERPDLVVLNEVTRGWALAAGADEALWLSQRLGMELLFGPSAGDLHGNAVLTRWRADATGHRYLATLPSALPRGAVEARVALERAELVLAATHLDYPDGAGVTREAQLRELLSVVGNRRPALVVGDLNARPESPELAPLREVGLVDVLAALGTARDTWPADRPNRRIDYVFTTPDIQLVTGRVIDSAASDHLPVIVRIRLP